MGVVRSHAVPRPRNPVSSGLDRYSLADRMRFNAIIRSEWRRDAGRSGEKGRKKEMEEKEIKAKKNAPRISHLFKKSTKSTLLNIAF